MCEFLRRLFLVAALWMLSAPLSHASVATDSLIGYWKFDEGEAGTCPGGLDICDSSGHGGHGSRNNDLGTDPLPQWTADKPSLDYANSFAMDFDGTDDYVSVSVESTGAGPKTVSLWFNTDTVAVGSDTFFHASCCIIDFGRSGDKTLLRAAGTADKAWSSANKTGSGTLEADRWYHMAVYSDGTGIYWYLDGVLDGSDTSYTGDLNSMSAIAIGARLSNDPYTDGSIDDVRVYNRVLSETEIQQLAGGDHLTAKWMATTSTDWETASNWDVSAVPDPFTNVLIQRRAAGNPVLSASISGSSITIVSDASLDLNGYDLEFVEGGALKGGGTLRLVGNESIQNLDNLESTSTGTVLYYGTGSYNGLAAGHAYHDLRINSRYEQDLIGYWRLDEEPGETVFDSSNSNINGEHVGGPVIDADTPPLQFGNAQALYFDGTNYVLMNSTTQMSKYGTGTVAAWVKRDVDSDGAVFAVADNDGSSWFFVMELRSSGALAVEIRKQPAANRITFNTAETIDAGEWHHVAFANDGSDYTVYFDGQPATFTVVEEGTGVEGIWFDDVSANAESISIGARVRTSPGLFFEGSIDDVRVYSRALSQAEVQNLVNGTNANGVSGTPVFTLTDNLDVSTLTIQAGSIDAGSHTLRVSDTWNNYAGTGAFTADTSTVDFDGGSGQLIRGSTDFYNLTITTATGRTIRFGSGSTQAVGNALTFTGAENELLTLAPFISSTAWRLDVSDSATQTLSYLSVSYSDASPGTTLLCTDNCTNSGNNLNWQFTVPTVAFASGTQTAAESGTGVSVTLSLSASTEVDVSVPFTVTGTASDGTDYTLVNTSPARIAAGQTSTGITVTFTDDADIEDDETIVFTMGTPVNALTGAILTHTLTLTSEDAASSSSSVAASSVASSSSVRPQSGGGARGSSLYTQQRIEAAFNYILALYDGRQDEAGDLIADEPDDSDDREPDDAADGATRYATTPASVAARRNRLFAIVADRPVIYGDVFADAWYAPYVSYVVEEEIAQGYADAEGNPTGEFGPANPVTLAEMLKMALEAAEESLQPGTPRNRTAVGSWASPYVATAEHLQLRAFSPDADVHSPATRGEVVQTILEVMGIPTGIKIPSPFADVPVDHPYGSAITTASAYGLVEGDTATDGTALNTFRPDEPINRAEVAKIVALVKEVLK